MDVQLHIGADQQPLGLQLAQPQAGDSAPSRLASNLSGCLRKAADCTKNPCNVVASASALVSAAGFTNYFYQKHHLPTSTPEEFVVLGDNTNPIDIMEYNTCILRHLQPAGVPGTPNPISNATFPSRNNYPSIPESAYVENCIQTVGTWLTHDLAIEAEHRLSGWHITHSIQVAWLAMAISGASTTLAVVVPYALNHMAQALENRAARSHVPTNPIDRGNTHEIELAAADIADLENPHQVPPADEAANAPVNGAQVEPADEAAVARTSVASKIWQGTKWLPPTLLVEGATGLVTAAAIWISAAARHKLDHLSPDPRLTTFDGIRFHEKTLADILPTIKAYEEGRRGSMQFDLASQIAAWTMPMASVAVCASAVAVKLTQCAMNHRQKALTTAPVALPENQQ